MLSCPPGQASGKPGHDPAHRDQRGPGIARPVPRDAGHRHARPQAAKPQPGPALKTDEPDPLIHAPARLKIAATPAHCPDGDVPSFTRLPDMIGLTPGDLLIL